MYLTKNLCHDTDHDGKCDQCANKMATGLRGRQCPAAAKERGRPDHPAVMSAKPKWCAKKKRPGLGDQTEQWLSKVGVTKERYVEAKKLFGRSPTCNCEARKQWLNSVSDWWRGEAS